MHDPPCLNLALQGDREALEELASACHAAVFGYLLRRAGSREDALDLAQDVLVRVLENLPGYRPRAGAGFMAWVFCIARNRYADSLRARKAWAGPGGDAHEPCTDLDATGSQALRNLDASALRQALAALADADRELLELRYFYGFSHRAMAEVLGVNPAIVKSRLHEALDRLRRQCGAMKGEGRNEG